MTSDFDNDEIKDSAFPVEFTDDGTSLDMYGVWVKNGPRDAPRRETTVTKEIDVQQFSETESVSFDDIPEMEAMPEISDLPDLPDFTISGTETEVEPDQGKIRFEEIETLAILHPETDLESVLEEEIPTAAAPAWKEVSDSDFNAVDASEFFDGLDLSADSEKIVETDEPENTDFYAGSPDTEITFEDILPQDLKTSGKNGFVDVHPVDVVPQSYKEEKTFSASDYEDISLEFIDTMEPTKAEPEAEPEEAELAVQPDEDDLDIQELPDYIEPTVDLTVEPLIVQSGSEISVDLEIPSDDDFSSFLDDLDSNSMVEQSGSAASSDTFDLDSFVDTFNASGGVSHENVAELYDDVEPVDLVLEFDESFIEDAEKIRATGSSVSESEFFNSEFGVELVDETELSSGFSDISDEFSNTGSALESIELSAPSDMEASSSALFEATSEFDDLLQSLDIAPAPSQAKAAETVRENKPGAFDLIVTEEEGFDSIQAAAGESVSADDFEVPLFGQTSPEPAAAPEAPAVKENLDIPVIRDYNETDLGDTMAPDFDDISAVEQELNDLTPDTGDETVVTNDKSTELLMIIADELSSIKQELTNLKSELSTFKAAGLTAEPGVQPEAASASDNSGFFSDDDTDETIALTGDELNNILITADFTEEKNDIEETPDIDDSIALSSFDETMMGEPEIPETLPDSILETPQLDTVAPIEVAHVNTIEDDISYLEGSEAAEPELDNVAIEEPDLETIDFDDEKLEEPELTEFNIDLSDIETDFANGQEVPVPESEPFSVDFETAVPFAEETLLEEPLLEEAVESEIPASTEIPVADLQVPEAPEATPIATLPVDLKNEIKSVLSYMDQLLESLPEDKIEEFARSEHFEVYKKLFEELGIS